MYTGWFRVKAQKISVRFLTRLFGVKTLKFCTRILWDTANAFGDFFSFARYSGSRGPYDIWSGGTPDIWRNKKNHQQLNVSQYAIIHYAKIRGLTLKSRVRNCPLCGLDLESAEHPND